MRPRVLLANEPRSYRQAIAGVLRALHPGIEVDEADQATLDREVLRTAPRLVICSHATPLVQGASPAWVELYTDHGPLSSVFVGGERKTVRGMELPDILAVLERALCLVL